MYYYIIDRATLEVLATATTEDMADVIASRLSEAFGRDCRPVWYGDLPKEVSFG
ncbi:MAG: hypothetical protein IJ150_09690 [Bacteroidales bacterium]|nr:hypothetical protein [Bacteroidales bacterium]